MCAEALGGMGLGCLAQRGTDSLNLGRVSAMVPAPPYTVCTQPTVLALRAALGQDTQGLLCGFVVIDTL